MKLTAKQTAMATRAATLLDVGVPDMLSHLLSQHLLLLEEQADQSESCPVHDKASSTD
tara:strand:- start:1740 stop:1913 length:174 start_codon:yes stop_codon:yes gene_type:complete